MKIEIDHEAKGVPIPLTRFARAIGRDRVTVWRWTKLGWLTPTNIAGRPYLMPEEVERFNQRALAGEFYKKPTVPPPPRSSNS